MCMLLTLLRNLLTSLQYVYAPHFTTKPTNMCMLLTLLRNLLTSLQYVYAPHFTTKPLQYVYAPHFTTKPTNFITICVCSSLYYETY